MLIKGRGGYIAKLICPYLVPKIPTKTKRPIGGIKSMFFRKKNVKENVQDELNNIQLQEEFKEQITECNPEAIRKVIGGKLYDTLRATHICNLCVQCEEIPDYKFCFYHLGGEEVSIYKGSTEWFIEVYGDIKPVGENWIKDILGQYNVEKYIELFGEPELA